MGSARTMNDIIEKEIERNLQSEQHKKAADELSRAVRAGKADTQGVGPTQAANYVFLENQQRVKKGNKDSRKSKSVFFLH